MQLRISNAQVPGPFNNAIPQHIRRHKQPIFTYHTKQLPQNIYYEKNPYLLRINPSEPRVRPILSKSKHQHQSRQHSDHSSHRSLKVIRVNGLRQAEKPKVIRMQDQQSAHSSRAHEQNRRQIQREIELQNENRVLRQQNQALKQKLRINEENKQRQLSLFQQRITELAQKVKLLEQKVESNEQQWKSQMKGLVKGTE